MIFDVFAADGQQFELGAETLEERDAWTSTIQALISAYEDSRAAIAQLHQDSELRSASDAMHASALNSHSFGAGLQPEDGRRVARVEEFLSLAQHRLGHLLQRGLEDLEPVRRGAAVLVLRGPEQTARVHICRRGRVPRGVAWTRELDLLLMNGGDGDAPTREGLGRVLRLLAADMRGPAPDGLLSHDERLALYADDAEVLT